MDKNVFKLSESQCKKLIESLNKTTQCTRVKFSPSHIVVSRTMYEYLKKNYPNKFNF